MRIRKNRTSSRVVPEFCLAHDTAFQKLRGFRVLDSADFGESPQPLRGKPSLDASKMDQDLTMTHDSIENDCTSIRIRDFVLAHPGDATLATGRFKNLSMNQHSSSENSWESPSANRQAHGSGSDEERATNSSDRTSRQRSDGKLPGPAPVTSDKVKSDASSQATSHGNRRKSDKDEHAESDITRDSPQKLTTMSVTGNGNGVVARRRKRNRSKMGELEVSMPHKSEEDQPAAEDADLEVSSGAKEKKLKVQEGERDAGSGDRSAASSSFPVGWSYRGLAQIAEQDKPPQGKQCGRTDGRSWRCPLKVQEGFTLCEHHLSKFRLKKLSKESKRQKLANRRSRRQRQQKLQNLQQEGDEEEEEQQQEEREQDGPNSASDHDEKETEKGSQIPATTDPDIPVRSRRKHRTVKLSVL